jgi:hypothetical protein
MMKLPKINSSFSEGFLDGLGAGLFTRLRRPGAPDELIDSRSVSEFLQDEEFYKGSDIRYPDFRYEDAKGGNPAKESRAFMRAALWYYRRQSAASSPDHFEDVDDRLRELARQHGVHL